MDSDLKWCCGHEEDGEGNSSINKEICSKISLIKALSMIVGSKIQ